MKAEELPPDAEIVNGIIVCKVCRKPRSHTAPVNMMLFEVPVMPKPFRLWTADDYTLCANTGCASVMNFIDLAIDSNAPARHAVQNQWTRVRILFNDLNGWLLTLDGGRATLAQA